MKLIALLMLFAAISLLPSRACSAPNILWLSCEDISAHLGCYGDPYAKTPNLDTLAAEGTRFTNVFTSAGVCAPCRSGIITGMYQNSIGTHHMRCDATLPDWLKPFPLYLRDAGYYCTNNSKTDYQFSKPKGGEIWDNSSGKAHWNNRKAGQPFFAVFNFTGCHESGIENESKYRSVTKNLTPDQRQDPNAFENIPPYYPDTPVVREDWKRNYELITAMDAWAGERIQEVKDAGEWENTIVIYWSDHGVGLPRAKRWLYDSGTHVPYIAHVPEKFQDLVDFKPGTVDDRLINSVDFGATVLDLAGLPIPDYMHGRSHAKNDTPREFVYGARDRMDERYDIIRAVRDKRFRYIRNFEPLKPYYQYMNTPEKGATMMEIRKAEEAGTVSGVVAQFSAESKPVHELYDLENDPHEINNLADSPGHAAKLAEMIEALTAWQLEIGDLGLMPESEITERVKNAGSTYDILHGKEDQTGLIVTLTGMATKASSPEAIPELIDGLSHRDAAVRYWGATGLGNLSAEAKDEAGISEQLGKTLADSSPAVRIASARALCRMGDTKSGLPVLAKELSGDNEWARLEAAIVLDELEATARPELESLQAALKDQPNKYIIRVANKAVNDLLGTENKVP
ncbi:sulfatase-like hydrolase/transferase [Verrucomicrobiales bacterium BCK34]|nr:sulfatase-like hydrolase/transferase [Verrucomicrobiales bacterium BCK34]